MKAPEVAVQSHLQQQLPVEVCIDDRESGSGSWQIMVHVKSEYDEKPDL
jgi:hypothetical protein